MHRPVCALLLLAAACGELRDEDGSDGRPLEVEYLTQAILAPSCGQTQCHSTFHQAGNLVFDHPDRVRSSLLREGEALLSFDSSKYDPRPIDAEDIPNLIVWITEIDPFGKGIGRMPFDAPLAKRDVELLKVWIRAPREDSAGNIIPGGFAQGAQCNPDLYGGLACNLNDIVTCGDDWNFSEIQETCADGCQIVQPVDSTEYVVRCTPSGTP